MWTLNWTLLLNYIREKLAEADTTQRINNLFTALIQQHPHEAKDPSTLQ